MDVPGALRMQFDGKEGVKKFFYVYENLVMKDKTEKEKADKLVAELNGDALEFYFGSFTEDSVLTTQAK